MGRKPTLRDIASAASVSKSTVSLVLQNSPKVAPETRARVREILDRFNYFPNASAKNLVRGKTRIIGLATRFFRHEFIEQSYFGELLGGLLDVFGGLNYHLMLYNMNMPFELNTDGIIFVGVNIDDPFCQDVRRAPIPIVFANRRAANSDINYVTTDFVGGGIIATRHLLELGHRHIAYISGPTEHPPQADRLRGYRMALDAAGVRVDDNLIVIEPAGGEQCGYHATEFLTTLSPPPTAIFVATQDMALGVLRCLKDKGWKIPDDISIVCFDDSKTFSEIDPPLTVIRQPSHEIGVRCAQMMVRLIEGGKVSDNQMLLPAELVVRKSCERREGGARSSYSLFD